MTDNTEPTIDELVEMCFDDLCINNTGNYIRITFGDKSMNVDYEHFLAFRKRIEALISNQVAKARIDELIGVRGWTEYEPDPKYSPAERFHIVPYTYLTNRIAELNGVKE